MFYNLFIGFITIFPRFLAIMLTRFKSLTTLLVVIFCSNPTWSQDIDLEKITKEDPLKVTGSISAMNRFYTANGIPDRQENYIGTLAGRLNFSVFGIAVPVSGIITTQNRDFNQPFNRISVRPSYKWAKAYFGYSNMNYSSYTLAGHTFLGAGVELNPKKIRIAANYGRFASAIPINRPADRPFVPAFDRRGYGGKVGYGDDNNFIDFIFHRAKDDQDSWGVEIPDSSTVTPAENLVLGTAFKFTMIKNLTIAGEYARSAFTTDTRDGEVGSEPLFSDLGFANRASTLVRDAFKIQTTYRMGRHNISGMYERIAPDYQTMGAYFFNNDIENITAAYSTSLLKNRVVLAVNGGTQRNNLSGDRAQESVRTIVSANVVYAKSSYSVGFNFSNFSSDVRFLLNEALDSLNAVIVTRTAALFGTYVLDGRGSDKHLFSLNLSQQTVTDDFASDARSANNRVYTGVLNYTYKLAALKMDVNGRFNYNRNDLDGMLDERYGPGVSLRKMFLQDRLVTQAIVNFFFSDANNSINSILSASMKIKSNHLLGVNVSAIRRTNPPVMEGADELRFGETIGTVNYTYTF